ncbi:MAG: SAF domain-containing protein [Bifidobacteriaceae bacterium]|nr:SAF domain-containing protein [Bifidobacteriaceae bacterium]
MGKLPERRSVRAFAWRARWAIWALFAALLVRIALPGIVSAATGGELAVVLARNIAAGSELTAADVRLARIPAGVLPANALDEIDQAVGGRVVIDLPSGMVLVEGLLGEASAVEGIPAGLVAVALRLNDPGLADVLAAGDRIDVMASAGASASGSIAPAQRLATAALVLDVPGRRATESGDTGGLLPGPSGTGSDQSGLLLVGVIPEEAALISGASSWAVITAVLVPA